MNEHPSKQPCASCRGGQGLDFDFTMAFQPIVDLRDRSLYAYEALVRGTDGSGAAAILGRVNDQNRMHSTRRAGSRPSNWRRALKCLAD